MSEQTLPFHYDDLASVEALLEQHPGQIACFVLEPERTTSPSEGFLRGLAGAASAPTARSSSSTRT